MRYKNIFGIGYSIIIITFLINIAPLLQSAAAQKEISSRCSICQQDVEISTMARIHCGHNFCLECIVVAESVGGVDKCPICRTIFNGNDNKVLNSLKQDLQFFPARFAQIRVITSELNNSLSELKQQFYLHTGQSDANFAAMQTDIRGLRLGAAALQQKVSGIEEQQSQQVQSFQEGLQALSRITALHATSLEELKQTVLKDSKMLLKESEDSLTLIRQCIALTQRVEGLTQQTESVTQENTLLRDILLGFRKEIDDHKSQQAATNTLFDRDNRALEEQLMRQQRLIDSIIVRKRQEEKRIRSQGCPESMSSQEKFPFLRRRSGEQRYARVTRF